MLPLVNTAALTLALGLGLAHPPLQHEKESPVRKPLPSAEEIAKLPKDGGPEFNRLVFEPSPYLLQHARNPVDWYPWGPEAFAAAKTQDKPIFLSIGYSTCHWCHVMEHESFEDDEVAKLMNAAFICVKVDREERPDVDNVYMTFTQAFSGRGGWPMTVLMTADQKPFHAETYIPKHRRGGRYGMMDFVPSIQNLWATERDKLLKQSEEVLKFVQDRTKDQSGGELDRGVMRLARLALLSGFDAEHGGFPSSNNKFPIPHNLRFLLREHAPGGGAPGDERVLGAVTKTLDEMRLGGIWDHVGFGFHRYSTDTEWLLPHFEKMLYDQALIAMAYTEAWQVTGNPEYKETVEQIFTYVLRDMTDPGGGFYSAEDADSEGEEGLFYIWTMDELSTVLGEEDAQFWAEVYGFEEAGNFKDESTGRVTGHNIPHLEQALPRFEVEISGEQAAPISPDRGRIERLRRKLFDARKKRIHPLKDDKILTDWNGLMIAAMAQASRAMDRADWTQSGSDWTQAATSAANHAWGVLRNTETGELYKRARGGQAGLPGLLEDYAFLAWGFLELHQTTQDVHWLNAAKSLVDTALEQFWDKENGGFRMSPESGETLILDSKEVYDGAIPSGNSVMLWNLCRLARLSGNVEYEERADELVRAFSKEVKSGPRAFTQFLIGLDFQLGPSQEIVIVGDADEKGTQAMLRTAQTRFLPRSVLLHRPLGEKPSISVFAPYTKDLLPLSDAATAYVCTNFTCQAPTTDFQAFQAALGQPSAEGNAQDAAQNPAPPSGDR